jgi:hypothetical protein
MLQNITQGFAFTRLPQARENAESKSGIGLHIMIQRLTQSFEKMLLSVVNLQTKHLEQSILI